MRRVLFGLLAAGLFVVSTPARAVVFDLPLNGAVYVSGPFDDSIFPGVIGTVTLYLSATLPEPTAVMPSGVNATSHVAGASVSAAITNQLGGGCRTFCLPQPVFVQEGLLTTSTFIMTYGPGVENVFAHLSIDLPEGYLISASAVPEPSTWAMMVLGFAGIGAFAAARRRPTAASLRSL
jgi:hypothetical protein